MLDRCPTQGHASDGATSTFHDATAANTLVTASHLTGPDSAWGLPDGVITVLASNGIFGAQFSASGQPVTLLNGSEVHVYWRKQGTDSSAAIFQSLYLDPDNI